MRKARLLIALLLLWFGGVRPSVGQVSISGNNAVCSGSSLTLSLNYNSITPPSSCGTSLNMSSGTTQLNPGTVVCFYDSGGPNSNYGNRESYTRTFTSSNGTPVFIYFHSCDLGNGLGSLFGSVNDYLYVYDGPNTSSARIGYSGSSGDGISGLYVATSGSLTVRFESNWTGNSDGWSAKVGCNAYQWSNGSTSHQITETPVATTTYTLTVSGFCNGSASHLVTVVNCGATGCPSVAPAECGTGLTNIVVDCENPDVTLCANAVATADNANDYVVLSIPYDPPFGYTEGTRIFTNAQDDTWGDALNLPFGFCYYGNTYNQVVPGANSVATFNTDVAGGSCAWSYSASLPSSSLFSNTIFACYRDIYPNYYSGDGIYEGILGSYPCRSYVLSFNNVALFGSSDEDADSHSCLSVRTFSTMIVLYEGTNIIDIYMRDAPTCTAWNGGRGIVGIQNSDGTAAIVPVGRNTGSWTAHNEAWRFIPTGQPVYTVTWYQGSDINGPVVGTGDQITVTPNGSTDYTARLQYAACNGETFDIANTCHVTVSDAPQLQLVDLQDILCYGGTTGFLSVEASNGTPPYTYLWTTDNPDNPANGHTGTSHSNLPADIYHITVTDAGGCSATGTYTLQNLSDPLVAGTLSASQVICMGDTPEPLSVTGCSGGVDSYYVWQQSTEGNSFIDIEGAGNDSIYLPNNLTQNTCYRVAYISDQCGTVYTDTVCITLNNPSRTEIEDIICYGVPYAGNGFDFPADTLVEPGLHTDSLVLQNADGCDSIVVMNLTVLPPVTASEERTIPEDELPYEWNGVTFTSEGTQTAVLTDSDGCDSTVTMILHVTTNEAVILDTTVCASALPLTWYGVTFTEAGTQTVSDTNEFGHTHTMEMTVNVIEPVFVTVRDGVCQNEPYSGYGFTVTSDETAEPGELEMSQLYATALGCDSTVTLQLTVHPNYDHHFEVVACDSMVWNGQVYWQSGSYTQQFSSIHGCDSTVTKDVQVVNSYLELVNHTPDFCQEYRADLEVFTDLGNIQWSTGEEGVHNIVAHHSGAYVVTANTAHCEAFARIVIPPCDFNLYIPNAITPSNLDGINDYFCLPEDNLSQMQAFEIGIYDRWGRLVFQSDNPYFRWDGRDKGKLYINNTYTYYIKYSLYAGGDFIYSGVITVL